MSISQQYAFSDRRLRDRSLLEFARALRNERMIALTGSMSTEALGYDSWEKLGERIAQKARDVAEDTRAMLESLGAIDAQVTSLLGVVAAHAAQLSPGAGAKQGFTMDRRVQIGVIRDCFELLDTVVLRVASAGTRDPLLPLTEFNRRMAELVIKRRSPPPPADRRRATIGPLIESLGISRFATLNYDFELERALMLRAGEREALGRDDTMSVMSFVHQAVEGEDHSRTTRGAHPIERDRINRLSRVMGDGRLVESDVLDRERPDRLLEFGIGSSDADRHIMHLHGRADRPRSMIVDMRDYDRLYRLDDLHRNPFEFGLRVLFAGNPILFVGLGMTETEVNDKLQYLVSNSPHRRMAPAFLLWNTIDVDNSDGKNLQEVINRRRLDFIQRLGVQVIFDEDLRGGGGDWIDALRAEYAAAKGDKDLCRAVKLSALSAMIEALPSVIAKLNALPERTGEAWRSIAPRLAPGLDQPIRLWGTSKLRQAAEQLGPSTFAITHRDVTDKGTQRLAVMVGIAEPGFGRGAFAEKVIQTDVPDGQVANVGGWILAQTDRSNRLLVNAGFSYDSDAMLNAIALFLARRCRGPNFDFEKAGSSREELFMEPAVHDPRAPLLIVINGIDRFFGFDGSPLSAELDHLLRCVALFKKPQPKIQWVLLGTDRIRRYFKTIGIDPVVLRRPPSAPEPGRMRSRYLDWVAERFQEEYSNEGASSHRRSTDAPVTPASAARITAALGSEPESARRAFFDAYLAPTALAQVGADCPTSFEVLRAMSFIGAPVESAVLLHVPKVAAMLREFGGDVPPRDYLVGVMTKLRRLGLAIRVQEFDATLRNADGGGDDGDGIWTRYGLHRSLATELRERHGVPISESKLSTTFNMSLFAAQPGDNYAPEPQLHDELGDLVDRLIGAWKDGAGGDGRARSVTREAFESIDGAELLSLHPDEAAIAYAHFSRLCQRHSAACLRAALTVVRNYFSTASLLTLDRDDRLVSPLRDGALTEHGERLDRLLKGFGKVATARQVYRRLLSSGALGVPGDERETALELGPEPFYPDDLVWLHNERGVVKMVQGNLYDARRSFSLARRANERHLERAHRGHNWRRISLNTIGLLIERSRLKRAETRIDQVEASVDEAKWRRLGWPSPDAPPQDQKGVVEGSRVAAILRKFGDQASVVDDCMSGDFTREEILAVGLTTAYRGLIAHMRGRYRTAEENYARGISILRRLGEQRAYALFQRHFASLRRFTRGPEDSLKQIEFSIAAAASVRQMDISYRAHIVKAVATRRAPSSDPLDRRLALEAIREALEYSALTDSYRVRIEASSALAREMRASGDYDTALKYASDALAIACRYGHSLHKVSLRVEIGQILVQRGDPKSGDALMERAVDTATRNGLQRTVRVVQPARNTDSRRQV